MEQRDGIAVRSVALVLALALGSCGGGGPDAPPLAVGFESWSSSVAEGARASLVVVLHNTGAPLETALDVDVTPSGAATAGSDFQFPAGQTVRFDVGSVHGATVTLDVDALPDDLVEGGDETLVLTLTDPTAGAVTVPTHSLAITETDFAEVAFVETSSSVDEGDPYDLEVELDLDPGDSLGVDLQVSVSDLGTGSASGGADYATLAPQTLTFPSGSVDGTRRTISVVSLEDASVEGDETVDLMLTAVSGQPLILAGTSTLTIADDDVSGPFLVVDGSLFGAAVTRASSGDSFHLGTAALDSGGNDALELWIQNQGDQPITLEPLQITGDFGDFAVDLQTGPSSLPAAGYAAFPFEVAQDLDTGGTRMTLDEARFAALEGLDHVTLDGVVLPGGGEVTLVLERVEIPLPADAVVRVDGVEVARDDLLGDLSAWRGTAVGYAESEAFLSFSSTSSQGWLRLGEGLGMLHLTTEHSTGGPTVRWLWDAQLQASYTGDPPGVCAGERLVPGQPVAEHLAPAADVPTAEALTIGLTQTECRIAIETDYQLFERFGSTAGVTQYVTQLMAAVSEAYERDVQTTLTIAYLGIHSTSADGWTSQDDPANDASDLLDEFQAAWAGSLPAGADLAHFVSGASLGGGTAYRGVLCNSAFGFGVSGSVSGNIDWGSFTGAPSNLNWDFVVVAHELGHNFGARHTHDYCPPVDNCYSNCQASNTCEPGTLMSYCHLCGGMANLSLEFHPFIAQTMRSFVDSSCLGDAALAPGGDVSLTVSFEPTSATGSLSAQVQLDHSAPNEPSPFLLSLTGSSTP